MVWCVFLNVLSVCHEQKPKRVKAMYNCVADNPDELTFSEGEIIVVDGEEDQEWWVSNIMQLENGRKMHLAKCLKNDCQNSVYLFERWTVIV